MIKIEDIKDPSFIKNLNNKELKQLAKDIRTFLIENISKTGGHLSSNLGIVELTIAMFYVFDPENDKFIYDVGHQSYVHKILTGRAKDFKTLRQFNGLSGYINKDESKYDVWESGHSSTSISAAAGMIVANKENANPPRAVVVIGDSSISNGIAFEGLNFLGSLKEENPIIIINDNKMGISKSVGAMTRVFSRMRGTKAWRRFKRVCNIIFPKFITNWFHQIKRGLKGYLQSDNIFEDMGFDYYGPIDGNDIKSVIRNFERVKQSKEPVVIHLITKKGCGYPYAEDDDIGNFHGVGPFCVENGKPLAKNDDGLTSYSQIVANKILDLRKKEDFFVITPAMKQGACLDLFASLYPKSFYDVGISEEHAAVMAAGIALSNKKVVLLMYSTFAQRAYDQFLNDIARRGLNVIIGIDRAGIVGEDGATHQGIYDVAMFNSMPNFTICMGKDGRECMGLFSYALKHNGPIVVRYPKGRSEYNTLDLSYEIVEPTWEILKSGSKAIIISYGSILNRITKTIEENNLDVCLVNARFIRPIDEKILLELFKINKNILIIEECVNVGTLLANVLDFAVKQDFKKKIKGYGISRDTIVPHGNIDIVLDNYGFSKADILKEIVDIYENWCLFMWAWLF